ncbi:hypothetical protein ACWIG4_18155 [Streptomyces sp. NPDC002248]
MIDAYRYALRSIHRDAYAGTPDAGRSCGAGCGAWPCATIRRLDAEEARAEMPPPAARAAVLREAADLADRLGEEMRENDGGWPEEWSSREVRDAVQSVASAIRDLADEEAER